MKLTPAQREVLGQLAHSQQAQTAQALGVPFKTLAILRRNGCVQVVHIDNDAKLSTGVYYVATEKGRQEAAA